MAVRAALVGEFGIIPRAPFRDASEIAAPVAVSCDARVNAHHWNGHLKVRPFQFGALAPYVTGGIGSFTSDTVVSDVMIGPTRLEDRRTATNFATNVGAGVNYQINRWSVWVRTIARSSSIATSRRLASTGSRPV